MSSIKKLIKKFVRRRENWAIAIYTGDSPDNLAPRSGVDLPVLTAQDVTDVKADLVADPFMVKEEGRWYMFFEIWNLHTDRGEISLATSDDAIDWEYQQVVMAEPFHLSYPYVFKWNGEYYLIPESSEAKSVRLYQATNFPTEWCWVKNLLEGRDFIDPSIFYHDGYWWMFVSSTANDILQLYYAEELTGNWREHPASPIIENNKQIARPGGRVIVTENRIVRYTQDCQQVYGYQVRAFEITHLTPTTYAEQEVSSHPIIQAKGSGWNKVGMHNVDPHCTDRGTWIACVDGYRNQLVLGSLVKFDL